MKKAHAIQLLGRSRASAAKALGCSYQAVNQWPDDLPPSIEARVLMVVIRRDPVISRLVDQLIAASLEEPANV